MSAVARIIAGAVVTFLMATIIIYGALSLAPGDPAVELAGPRATPEMVEQVRQQYGLDEPLPLRYINWLRDAAQGDFGQSMQFRQSTGSLLAPRVGATIFLVTYALVIIAVLGLLGGMLPSIFRSTNTAVTVLASLGVAIPTFVAATVLIQVFSLDLGWFPTYGEGSGQLLDRLYHLTLPAIALALSWSAYVAQITRASVRDQQTSDHVETARGRGLYPTSVFRRHVMRNAAAPIVTIFGLTAAGLIAGSIVVETAFNIGGIGSLLVESVLAKDYNVVLAISLILVAAFVVANAAADLAHLALDPRARTRAAA